MVIATVHTNDNLMFHLYLVIISILGTTKFNEAALATWPVQQKGGQ